MQLRSVILVLASLVLSVFLATGALTAKSSAAKKSDHVRWDIISLNTGTNPPTISSGGEAFASAISGSAPSGLKIRFTGSGTFVAPASGKTSSGVTGGGTWETFNGAVSTGSGTYEVTKLVKWEFANFQTGAFIDTIGDTNERANGSADRLFGREPWHARHRLPRARCASGDRRRDYRD